MPDGLENCTAAPLAPSLEPAVGDPATVVTAPEAVTTWRISLFPTSATYKLPAASSVNAVGLWNIADVPGPSVVPCIPLPARVLTTAPPITIFRIWLLL